MVKANEMTDRGTNALKTHMSGCDQIEMRQTRRGKYRGVLLFCKYVEVHCATCRCPTSKHISQIRLPFALAGWLQECLGCEVSGAVSVASCNALRTMNGNVPD